MSWGADNPELYNEIIRKGIVRYLDKLVDKAGFQVDGTWLEGYQVLVEVLQASSPAYSLYNELLRLANKDICNAEADYWGGRIDAAKEYAEGRRSDIE